MIDAQVPIAIFRVVAWEVEARPGLLPCPGCGCLFITMANRVEPTNEYYAACEECEIEGPPSTNYDKAHELWNTTARRVM
jgi:predicted RNA-binding Zn-ribbon protein involved in translation (DUF1610 family)